MSWFREMGALLRAWWQVERDYRASMRELRKIMKRQASEARWPTV